MRLIDTLMSSRPLRLGAVVAALFAPLAAPAVAADYPSRPITVFVPYPAGGGTDIVARTLTGLLEKELGVPINVVNKAGGGGIPGQTAVANAKPDGYTLGVIASDISLYKPQGLAELTFADMTPIGQTNELVGGVTVIEGSPYKTMQELVAAIKAKPGELKATGAAPGSNWNIGFAGMMLGLGLDPATVIWVPTQGGTAGHLDVAAGNSTFATASLAEGRALIESNKIKPLAVMSKQRLDSFPDVPTLKETTGIDWTFALWHGMVGPKGLPDDIVAKLAPAVKKVAESEEFRKPLRERGFTPVYRDPAQFREFMAQDLSEMQRVFDQLAKLKQN
ncbi:tripartite tricarboxylate transporter substrate binding protein [Ancylobacter sp. A5.8]|uniref:tripartite tricarboxylate transporter substrate binding protein n=1 Tax=Ancylobacter gelatini TaxID=2919920 RepID=UPI001F4EEA27|nr:tripartite tricarboxylate transporter substrate binding protein [Ancylobacter gelatini]MCJ8145194.1 tripartite tricarboxylate transporter substrate binding protein [Ancylobacter gelatini]